MYIFVWLQIIVAKYINFSLHCTSIICELLTLVQINYFLSFSLNCYFVRFLLRNLRVGGRFFWVNERLMGKPLLFYLSIHLRLIPKTSTFIIIIRYDRRSPYIWTALGQQVDIFFSPSNPWAPSIFISLFPHIPTHHPQSQAQSLRSRVEHVSPLLFTNIEEICNFFVHK